MLRLSLFALSLLCVYLAALDFREQYRFADLISVGREADINPKIPNKRLRPQVKYALEIPAAGICRTDILKAGAAVLIRDLDRQNPDQDYESWAAAISVAEGFFLHALSCMPADGNIWLRLAIVRQQIAEEPVETARLLSLSQHYAPSEAGVLRIRMQFWNTLSERSLQLALPAIKADIRTLCSDRTLLIRRLISPPATAVQLALPSDQHIQTGKWC